MALSDTEKQKIKAIIQAENPEELVRFADKRGRQLASREVGLTTSQIRNIFGEARKIEARWHTDQLTRTQLILLKPKLAYQANRHRPVEMLSDCLVEAIDAVAENWDDTDHRFRRFMSFFEAILAYHKAYGGRDN